MHPFNIASRAFATAAIISSGCAPPPAASPQPAPDTILIQHNTSPPGAVMPQIRLIFTTVGVPSGYPVRLLPGTTGSARSMLGDGVAGALYGPGQPLDATRYYIIIPDAIGNGRQQQTL